MQLPTIPVTAHVLKTPLWKTPIEYRAYTCGEESIMIQNKDLTVEEKLNSLRQVLKQCLISDVDIDKLPYVIIEQLFVGIRQHSAGETINVSYRCKADHDVDGETQECGGTVRAEIDLSKCQLVVDEDIKYVITLHEDPEAGDIGVKMKLPTIGTYQAAGEDGSFKSMVCHCIEAIFQGDEFWTQGSMSDEEWLKMVTGWWNTLTAIKKVKVIEEFFTHQPHILIEATSVCPKCGHTHSIKYQKITDFFI